MTNAQKLQKRDFYLNFKEQYENNSNFFRKSVKSIETIPDLGHDGCIPKNEEFRSQFWNNTDIFQSFTEV